MADQNGKGIAWTEETWNPVRGCSRVSAGCTRCYAEAVAARFSGPGLPYEGLAKMTNAGPRWTGKVKLIEEHLFDPLRWSRPRRVFVNSMSDLFHEGLTTEEIARVFAVMYLAHGHTFQVLTKRARRMREVLTSKHFYMQVLKAADAPRKLWPRLGGVGISDPTLYPHANAHLGVSVEDQPAAEERIHELQATPAAVRWLSVEPQIGHVDLRPEMLKGIHWVVIGGESGPDARPFDIQWARDLVGQCQAAGVKVFVKQLGAVPVMNEAAWRAGPGADAFEGRAMAPGWLLNASTRARVPAGFVGLKFTSKAGDPAEWPEDLRVREYPEARR